MCNNFLDDYSVPCEAESEWENDGDIQYYGVLLTIPAYGDYAVPRFRPHGSRPTTTNISLRQI